MRRPCAGLALAQVAFLSATGLSARAVYECAYGVHVLCRSQEGPSDPDIQSFPWHLACRDFTWISNIARSLDEQ